MYPWIGYDGRVSPLKLSVFVLLFVPATWLVLGYSFGQLGARPVNEAIHQTGLWMIRLLFVSLAITPIRQTVKFPQLIQVRRMIGVAAFVYGTAHLTLYAADEMFSLSKVVSEIALRIYLTIGFVALAGLTALAVTSTDGMVRRLGRRWQWLHRTIYVIGILATVHFFMQSKADVSEPIMMAGILGWLVGYRLLSWVAGRGGHVPVWQVALLGLVAPALTALGEAVYFWLKMGVDPARVLAANLSTFAGVRPAWIVLALGAAVAVVGMLRPSRARPAGVRPQRTLLREGSTT